MKGTLPPAGTAFGRLRVLGKGKKYHHWLCVCECGNKKEINRYALLRGATKSCGCLQKEGMSTLMSKHKKSSDPIYKIWTAMHDRCRNERCKSYENYGGRGIKVCERWEKFENFYADMGDRPAGKSLDRIDNDGPYAPWNCEWKEQKFQSRNKRNNIWLEYGGKRQVVKDWAREIGLHETTITYRLQQGWTVEEALTTAKWTKKRKPNASF